MAVDEVRQLQKRYCARALTVAILVWVLCFLADFVDIGKGFLLGTLFSIFNFILMGETLPLRLMKSRRKTFIVSLSSIFVRYALLALPLFLSIKSEQFNLYSTIVGIFSVQLMILLDQLVKLPCFMRNRQV